MSDSARNILAKRLKASEKWGRDKTPGSERVKLVPINTQSRSTSVIKKAGRLELVSPFFGKKSNGTLTDRMVTDNITPKTIETSTSYLKKIPVKLTRLKPPSHIHGSINCIGKSSKILDFILKIKENQNLHDDFWYFNRGQNPYDLVFTTFANKDQNDYFTLSLRGVAHFYKGEVCFSSLDEWERENSYYNKLKLIPFFKQFLEMKIFVEWQKLRRLRMMENRMYFLAKNLSFLNENMQESMVNVREKLYGLTKTDLIKIQANKIKSIDEFAEDQRQKATVQLSEIKNLLESIIQIIKRSCNTSMDNFLRLNVVGNPFDKDESYSNKILVYTNQAVSRSHHQTLGKFVRLIEYMKIQAEIIMCINNYSRLYKYVSQRTVNLSEKNPLLFLDASLSGSSMVFNPEFSKISKILRQDIKKHIKNILSFELLENHKCFEKYIKSLTNFDEVPIPTDLNPESILLSNPEIRYYRYKIRQFLEKCFKYITDFGKSWEPHFKLLRKNSEFKIKNKTTYSNQDLAKIIKKYKNQISMFSELPEHKDMEIIRINLSSIKLKLLSSPKQCLKKFQKFLKNLALDRGSSLLNDLISINKKLFEMPKSIHEFIKHIDTVNQIEGITEEVGLRLVDFKNLVEVLEDNKIAFTFEIKNNSAEISKAYETMRSRLSYICFKSETEKAKFVRILRIECDQVKEQFEIIRLKIKNNKLRRTGSNALENVNYLKDIGQEIYNLYQDIQLFLNYQKILGVPRTNMAKIEKVKNCYEILNSIWSSLHNWDTKIAELGKMCVVLLDTEEVIKDLNKYYEVGLKAKLAGKYISLLGKLLLEKIEKMRVLMNLVNDLRSSSLKEYHWRRVFMIIGYDINIFQPSFTVNDLLDSNIFENAKNIKEVILRACKENELIKDISNILVLCDSLKYDKLHHRTKI